MNGRAARYWLARRPVDVEREVLVVDLLVGAVGQHFLERLVEGVAQRGVLLAHGDAGAIAEDRAGIEEGGADELEILAGVGLEEAQLERDAIVGPEVEAAGGEI